MTSDFIVFCVHFKINFSKEKIVLNCQLKFKVKGWPMVLRNKSCKILVKFQRAVLIFGYKAVLQSLISLAKLQINLSNWLTEI